MYYLVVFEIVIQAKKSIYSQKNYLMKRIILLFFILISIQLSAQALLPPFQEWHGKSELLIVKSNNPWITASEKSDFVTTPTYDETMIWFKKLADASPLLTMVSIGKSVEGREIYMVIASSEKNVNASTLKNTTKPALLAQAGIHSGEIDGKDAGMMLLRDIAFGGKKELLNNVNFLFIPILSVDGHENSSPFNRPNQRGPENMGWRTNAQNLNLNRDYAKLDTQEIRAVIKVINDYNPSLYMDIHVTDGADYQYDITYDFGDKNSYSPSSENWLSKIFKPTVDAELQLNGHIPGPFLSAASNLGFSQGNISFKGSPRFSADYGDLRHLPSILIENHSLKPYKQRVLGTYVLLESTLKILAKEGQLLKQNILKDRAIRGDKVNMAWEIPQSRKDLIANDSITLLAVDSKIIKSTITNADYVEWLGKPVTMKVANYVANEPVDFIKRPKGYWIPASCDVVIERLKLHGIEMKTITKAQEVKVELYRITDFKFEDENKRVQPFEGHFQVNATTISEIHNQIYPKGSVYISTDQPLGDLAMLLLEPKSKDSFFSWGFFHSIFQRTEYMEEYIMEPLAKKMLADSDELRKEFEIKKAQDSAFANNQNAILTWFYSKTKYYDSQYLLYPVGREL
jgi:hypothetical protein